MRHLAAASIVAACLAIAASPASANGPCSVQEKTPTGFRMKCSKELHTYGPSTPALTVWSSPSTNLTAVSVSAPAGVTCAKRMQGGTAFFDCGPNMAANVEIVGSLTATGAQPCDINLYAAISYDDFGTPTAALIGSFDSCTTAAKHSTAASVTCNPSTVAAGKPTDCTIGVRDTSAGSKTTPTGSAYVTTAADGVVSNSDCTGLHSSGSDRSYCTFTYRPGSAGAGTHVLKTHYSGDGSHSASVGQGSVQVTPAKRKTATTVACHPATRRVRKVTHCTARVADAGAGAAARPTGSVSFSTAARGAFPDGKKCKLAPAAAAGVSRCSVAYKPRKRGSGKHRIRARYAGSSRHLPSKDTATLTVKRRPKH